MKNTWKKFWKINWYMKKKLSPKKYAELLINLTAGKKKSEIGKAIGNFANFLKKNGALSLAPEIIGIFERMCLAQEGKSKLEIKSARRLSARNRKNIVNLAERLFNEKKFEINEKVEEGLKGGFILKSNNRIVDMSLRGLLGAMEKSLRA